MYIFLGGIIPLAIITFYGPDLFSFIFGSQWEISGEIASLIIFWLFFTIVAVPSDALIPVLNLQKFFVVFQALLFVSRILLMFIIFETFETAIPVIFGLAIHGSLFNIFLASYVLFRARKIESISL